MMEGLHYARKNPVLAAICGLVIVMSLAVGVLVVRTSQLISDLRQETDDRVQLACDMSFANGQALLDTASDEEEVSPEVVELYRKNLHQYANEAIHKFDPDFKCEIPEADDEAPQNPPEE